MLGLFHGVSCNQTRTIFHLGDSLSATVCHNEVLVRYCLREAAEMLWLGSWRRHGFLSVGLCRKALSLRHGSAPGFHGKGAQTGGNTEGIPLFYIALDHYKHRAEKEATLQTQVILTELEEGRLHTTTLRVFEPRGTLRIAAVWQLLLQHSTPVSFRRFKNRVLWLSKENSLFILLFSHLIFFFYFFSRCSERLGGWHSTTP